MLYRNGLRYSSNIGLSSTSSAPHLPFTHSHTFSLPLSLAASFPTVSLHLVPDPFNSLHCILTLLSFHSIFLFLIAPFPPFPYNSLPALPSPQALFQPEAQHGSATLSPSLPVSTCPRRHTHARVSSSGRHYHSKDCFPRFNFTLDGAAAGQQPADFSHRTVALFFEIDFLDFLSGLVLLYGATLAVFFPFYCQIQMCRCP